MVLILIIPNQNSVSPKNLGFKVFNSVKRTKTKQPSQRGLKNRHIQLIAIAGTIGTGLFLGAGKSIHLSPKIRVQTIAPTNLFLVVYFITLYTYWQYRKSDDYNLNGFLTPKLESFVKAVNLPCHAVWQESTYCVLLRRESY